MKNESEIINDLQAIIAEQNLIIYIALFSLLAATALLWSAYIKLNKAKKPKNKGRLVNFYTEVSLNYYGMLPSVREDYIARARRKAYAELMEQMEIYGGMKVYITDKIAGREQEKIVFEIKALVSNE